ncbi:MAG: LytTR family transcriptional regulator [Clostridia bacterium]|nr:LytTR family transcriptional regulator [Clostridia bacterium]
MKKIGQPKTKEEITELLSNNDLACIPITYYGCEGLFVPVSDSGNCDLFPGIPVTTCGKDICIVYPHDIVYIAIEDRKSVMYLTDRKLETYHPIEHWKTVLDENSFAQPHYSYIVNLNYVSEVTRDFVKVRYGDKEELVYTSSRKIGAFRKAVAEFEK